MSLLNVTCLSLKFGLKSSNRINVSLLRGKKIRQPTVFLLFFLKKGALKVPQKEANNPCSTFGHR